MRIVLLCTLMALAVAAYAYEFPYDIPPATEAGHQIRQDGPAIASNLSGGSIWGPLQQMSAYEKSNAEIAIDLLAETTPQAKELASQIETAWNRGHYDQALLLAEKLSELTGEKGLAVSIKWRTPIETYQPEWGPDVRIGNRANHYIVNLDVHRASGNLFAVLACQEGSYHHWTVNFSTNGGATWSETFDWYTTSPINAVSATVVGDYCFVGYASQTVYNRAFIRRYSVTDGSQVNFSSGEYILVFDRASGDTVKEIALTSNQDFSNNRLYYNILCSSHALDYRWATADGESWTSAPPSMTDAARGLDATCNEGFATRFLWVSYITTSDSLKILARSGSWETVLTRYIGYASLMSTSIGAYHDTVTCFHDYYSGSRKYCRYQVTYNGGSSFFWGFVGDTTVSQELPDVAARDGGGVGVVFRHYSDPRQGRYCWRNYAGTWTTPVVYTDHEPYYSKPAIEYLGSGQGFGVVYLSWTSPVTRGAYFDYSRSAIEDKAQVPEKSEVLSSYPNPFNAATTIRFELATDRQVNLTVYDVQGRKVATLVDEFMPAGTHSVIWEPKMLASGIYFCRLESDTDNAVVKMVLVK